MQKDIGSMGNDHLAFISNTQTQPLQPPLPPWYQAHVVYFAHIVCSKVLPALALHNFFPHAFSIAWGVLSIWGSNFSSKTQSKVYFISKSRYSVILWTYYTFCYN